MLNVFLVNTVLILFGITLIITGIRNGRAEFPILAGTLFLYLSVLSISQNISKNLNDGKIKSILTSRFINTVHFINLVIIIIAIIIFSIKRF